MQKRKFMLMKFYFSTPQKFLNLVGKTYAYRFNCKGRWLPRYEIFFLYWFSINSASNLCFSLIIIPCSGWGFTRSTSENHCIGRRTKSVTCFTRSFGNYWRLASGASTSISSGEFMNATLLVLLVVINYLFWILKTLNTISAEKNSTIVFPLPIDMMTFFMKKSA